eukprot:1423761-Karenia_brevis.AAC.1
MSVRFAGSHTVAQVWRGTKCPQGTCQAGLSRSRCQTATIEKLTKEVCSRADESSSARSVWRAQQPSRFKSQRKQRYGGST